MAKALSSAVDIKLDGETYQLVPSLKAATAVSREFDGFIGAYQALGSLSLDACAKICRAGINRNIISSDDLSEAIYKTGIGKVVPTVSRYVSVLQNGGRDPDDVEASDDDDDDGVHGDDHDEGNGGN